MGHVDDRWYVERPDLDITGQPVTDSDGKRVTVKVPTERRGKGKRWQATWLVDGRERTASFERKVDAERHLTKIEADLLSGTFVDPRAGRITFRAYAEEWRTTAAHDDATRERVERTLRIHVYPVLGDRPIAAIRTSGVQAFVAAAGAVLAPSTLKVAYSVVVTIFHAATRDKVIASSPCEGVNLPDSTRRRREVQPPELDVVDRVAELLPARFRAAVDLVCGSGLRQGEAFGLEVERIDFLRRRELDVVQQMKSLTGRARFLAPPKTPESERTVPLAQVTLDAMAAHLAEFPAADVEIEDRTAPPKVALRTARLVFTHEDGRAVARHDWTAIWKPVALAVGLPPREGLHVLRHLYASLLIRHGEDVKVVQKRMGHSSAAYTLDIYGHLWPDADDRTREAVEKALRPRTDQRRTEAGP